MFPLCMLPAYLIDCYYRNTELYIRSLVIMAEPFPQAYKTTHIF